MPEIRDTETVPYTAGEMFDMVADVDRYKEFLPWCRSSRVLRREKVDVDVAEIGVGYGFIHTTFATRNTYRANRAIKMELVEGPFKFLEGGWHFEPVPGDGSHMSLDLRFEFSHPHLEAPFNRVFEIAMESMVQAFRERAAELYGRRAPGNRLSKKA